MPSTQSLSLGPHAATVQAALDRLHSERFIQRLWEKDASLWSPDPAVQETIRQRLGWLTITGVMGREVDALRGFAQEIREAGFTHAFLLGMGGSSLFSEVCRDTVAAASQPPPGLQLAILDTTDPTAIRTQQRRCSAKELLVIMSSKSGSTSEVSALSKYFSESFKVVDGMPGMHSVAITDAGTPLEAQAKTWRCRRVFVHGPGTGAEVGGRFSALTYFGLVPAALMGVDIKQLLTRAEEMFARCGPGTPIQQNPAAQLGAMLAALAQAGRDKATLLCSPPLASFGTWVEQLVAESVGKQGQGIAPIAGEPRWDPAAYGADRVFIELQLSSEFDGSLDRHVRALVEAGYPVVRIRWDDRYDLGGEAAKWEVATVILGGLFGMNPFDEPNVQESKDRTKALLEQYARDGRLRRDDEELCSDRDVVLYGSLDPLGAESLEGRFLQFFDLLRPRDYVAVLSFLPRTPAFDRAMQSLRERIGSRVGAATMLGFGPRYLHSTGQLYKGGPDAGLFLLFTAEEPEDLPIPGEPFSFGVLKEAQALGDFQAMRQKGRRILQVHIRGRVERILERVNKAIDDVGDHVASR